MSHHRVELKNVSYTYQDGTEAIRDISFLIHHGETIGLVGANGAGKSTVLKLMMGLVTQTEGEIYIGDLLLSKKMLPRIRQSLGYTFQNSDHQLFMGTVYEDVAFGPRNMKMDECNVEKCVNRALDTVGVPHLKDRKPYKLSGGEKRLASIASVLAMSPDILIMDEPSAALDPRARRKIINLLNQFEHTKILATHDMDMVLDTCDRIIVLHNGNLVYDGSTSEIFSNEDLLEKYYLEKPLSMQ
jgi:cobalt/nickel transport system ATP-binding protein